jgi:muramoyltetrapeptide carboxypeptidase
LKKINISSLILALFLGLNLWACSNKKAEHKVMVNQVKQPKYLKAGDKVVIVSPAGVLINKEKEIALAKATLESWGLVVKVAEHVFSRSNHFSGTDDQRASDFQKAINDPEIKAIWCARGGYGSVRIIDKIDFSALQKYPKWIIGYSDITVFHSYLNNLGIKTIHGMMPVNLVSSDLKNIQPSIASLKKALMGNLESYNIPFNTHNKLGSVKGTLVGGNLAILQSMLGSRCEIDMTGKILFFEDIGEYKYQIDRMLQSLKRAGYFNNCSGILIGDFTNIKSNTPSWGESIEELIVNATNGCNAPIAFGFNGGHELVNNALIFGAEIEMNVSKEGTVISF